MFFIPFDLNMCVSNPSNSRDKEKDGEDWDPF
jgi:hypothetical protein